MSTYRTLNADPDFAETPAAHTWRWSWHTRIHVAMLIVILALLIPYLGVWSVRSVDLHMTADAVGVATAHTSTAAKGWTAQAPQCTDKTSCFIRTFLPIARKASEQTGWPVALILAQTVQENGWDLPDEQGLNIGNEAACQPDGSDCTSYGSNCYGGGIVGVFCYAPTWDIALKQYVHVAQLSLYDGVAKAAKQSDHAAAIALGQSKWDAGRYTHDSNPGDDLIQVMDKNNFQQYDK